MLHVCKFNQRRFYHDSCLCSKSGMHIRGCAHNAMNACCRSPDLIDLLREKSGRHLLLAPLNDVEGAGVEHGHGHIQ